MHKLVTLGFQGRGGNLHKLVTLGFNQSNVQSNVQSNDYNVKLLLTCCYQATSLHCQPYRLKSNHVHVGPGLPRAFGVVVVKNKAYRNERIDCVGLWNERSDRVGLCDASRNIM